MWKSTDVDEALPAITCVAGTTTMTTASVRNQANSANLTYTITGNNWQAAALPYGDAAEAEPHAYIAQTGHPTLVYHRMPTPGTGATCPILIRKASCSFSHSDILAPTR